MGQRIIALAAADSRFTVVAALDAAASGRIGQDAGEMAGAGRMGIALGESITGDFDVLIDFSAAAATVRWLDACLQRKRPIVIGTTGHDAARIAAIESASRQIAVLKSANMSVGVNALLRAVEQVARSLGAEYDVEIIETHHRFKADAPSGTALALKDAVVRGRADLTRVVHGRSGVTGQRPPGEIGIHAVRCGDVVGEHDVRFSTLGETVVLRHIAHSRDTFARGALAAAAWLSGKPAGLYGMGEVLAARL
jgi:4-hydroxy-tetrahydrodipicolinate reductase